MMSIRPQCILLLIWFSSADGTGISICKHGWHSLLPAGPYQNAQRKVACVRKFESQLSWDEALDECRRHSAHLLALPNDYLLYDEAKLRNFLNETGFDSIWMGMEGTVLQGVHWEVEVPAKVIEPETEIPSSYTFDYGLTPTLNLQEKRRRKCGVLANVKSQSPGARSALEVTSCYQRLNFVCMKPATNVTLFQASALHIQVSVNNQIFGLYFDGVLQSPEFGGRCLDKAQEIIASAPQVVAVDAGLNCANANESNWLWLSLEVNVLSHLYHERAAAIEDSDNSKCVSSTDASSSTSTMIPYWTRPDFDDTAWPQSAAFGRASADREGFVWTRTNHHHILCRYHVNPIYPTGAKKCGDDWLWSPDSRYCYWASSSAATFVDAQSHCRLLNASLATPVDSFEHNLTIAAVPSRGSSWLGLYSNLTTVNGQTWNYTFEGATVNLPQPSSPCSAIVVTVDMRKPTPVNWSLSDCTNSINYVCQKAMSPTAPVNITKHPQSVAVWSIEVSSVQLGCKATNFDPLKPVVWVRDNGGDVEYLNNGAPHAGFKLGLHSVLARLGRVEYVQGYYRCEVWDEDGTRPRRLSSQSALVTMQDYVTLRVNITTTLESESIVPYLIHRLKNESGLKFTCSIDNAGASLRLKALCSRGSSISLERLAIYSRKKRQLNHLHDGTITSVRVRRHTRKHHRKEHRAISPPPPSRQNPPPISLPSSPQYPLSTSPPSSLQYPRTTSTTPSQLQPRRSESRDGDVSRVAELSDGIGPADHGNRSVPTLNLLLSVYVKWTTRDQSDERQSDEGSTDDTMTSLSYEFAADRIYRSVARASIHSTMAGETTLVIVRRTDACVETTVELSDSSGGSVTFPTASLGGTVYSREFCSHDGRPIAKGRCDGNFTTGGFWTVTSRHQCTESNSQLADLDRTIVNSATIQNVTSSVALLTRDVETLTPTDVTHASSVLDKIATAALTADSRLVEKIGGDFVDAVSQISSVDDRKLFESEATAHSCSRVISALELFVNNVVLPTDTNNISISRPNVSIGVFDLSTDSNPTSNQWVYGAGVENLTAGHTDSTNEHEMKLYWSSSKLENITDSGAILLSRDALESGKRIYDTLKSSYQNDAQEKLRVTFTVFRSSGLFQQSQLDPTNSITDEDAQSQTRSCFNNAGRSKKTKTSPSGSALHWYANSLVVSATINGIHVENLTDPVMVVLRLKQADVDVPHQCAFWDTLTSVDGVIQPSWSTEGLTTNFSSTNDSDVVVCYSRHLTNFAVIAGFSQPRHTIVAQALQVVSIIGLVLSITGLLLTIGSQILLFRKVRRAQSFMVLLHLSVSLLAVDILVITGLDKTESVTGCKAVAGLLLYFLLVSFSWMLVEAIVQYLRFVKVFNTHTSKFMLKTALPAYLFPALVLAIALVIDSNCDAGFLLQQPTHYCWLSRYALYYAFLLPLGLIMVTNVILFIMIIKGLTYDRPAGLQSTQSKQEMVKLQVMAIICCFIVMGLTWSFALMAFGQAATTMHFLFCIFNSLQGFLIFAFLNIRERPVRLAWKKLLYHCLCKPKWLSETTSTASSAGLVTADRRKVAAAKSEPGGKGTNSGDTVMTSNSTAAGYDSKVEKASSKM